MSTKMPSMSKSAMTAGIILLVLLSYFVFRSVLRSTNDTPAPVVEMTAAQPRAVPEVIVRTVRSEPHTVIASLKGRTEADRTVIVRSETTGTVSSASVREGQIVAKGTILCGLEIESRAARLAEAQAAVDASRLDDASARALEAKGWTTSNRAAATKAALDRAEAGLAAARIEMGKTKLKAPFSGVFETRMAEAGDFLSPGAACGEIVDLDPIVISVDATENQVSALSLSALAEIKLNDGTQIDGKVRYIARTANPQTRTFRIEVEAPNADYQIAAGLTASVRISLGEAPAVLLTPASLVLHDDGRVGVRYVDDTDTVRFAAIDIIDDASAGVWVTGLPENARLLSAGQDYVREGVGVKAVPMKGL